MKNWWLLACFESTFSILIISFKVKIKVYLENNNKDMIISFIYYATLSKFDDSSFPQCNVHTSVQGGCLAFTPLDGYLKLWELKTTHYKGFTGISTNMSFSIIAWDNINGIRSRGGDLFV